MGFQAGGLNTGSVLLLLLEQQQLAEKEIERDRGAAIELGVAFLEIGNISRELQRSQERFEKTVQWIRVGLDAVALDAKISSALQPATTTTSQPGPDMNDLYGLADAYAGSALEVDDRADKMVEEEARAASTQCLDDGQEARESLALERKLTKRIVDAVLNAGKKGSIR